VQARSVELEAQLAEVQAEAEAQVQSEHARVEQTRIILNNIYNSSSWKITRPLRSLKEFMSSFFGSG
jgi:hypothetical protein